MNGATRDAGRRRGNHTIGLALRDGRGESLARRFACVVSFAAIVCLLTVGTASAGNVLITPATYGEFGRECLWLSTKPKPVESVVVELVDENGVAVLSAGPLTLEPFDERTLVAASGGVFFCRATRTTGGLSKSTTLITACGRDGSSVTTPCKATVTSR